MSSAVPLSLIRTSSPMTCGSGAPSIAGELDGGRRRGARPDPTDSHAASNEEISERLCPGLGWVRGGTKAVVAHEPVVDRKPALIGPISGALMYRSGHDAT